ncbi:hypothetical protein CEV33_4827 [Brucella grignonensis]|uniref:Uncharacterized protein n=1 Tax=Brucella grignonensis TaxID=94627 RepID=A0A256FX92_9HYPH|nr:hypothetical protein CEV33_4827 [Brucella grignonensis]
MMSLTADLSRLESTLPIAGAMRFAMPAPLGFLPKAYR